MTKYSNFSNTLRRMGFAWLYLLLRKTEKIHIGPKTASKLIYIIKHDKHYDIITSPAALFNTSYFCINCLTGIDHIEKHECRNKYKSCRSAECHSMAADPCLKCNSCRRYFSSDTCLDNHIKNLTCATIQCCIKCNMQYKVVDHHDCGVYKCSYCNKEVECRHLCSIQKLHPTASTLDNQPDVHLNNTRKRHLSGSTIPYAKRHCVCDALDHREPTVFYYDCEAMQDKGVHIANLVVVHHEDGHQFIFDSSSSISACEKFATGYSPSIAMNSIHSLVYALRIMERPTIIILCYSISTSITFSQK